MDYVRGATIIRKVNPWDVGGRSPAERAAIAVELLREITRDIADVSSASATLLLRELRPLYERGTPNTNDVVNKVEAFLKNSMAERRLAEANMAAALLRRLYWLQIDEERDGNTVGDNSVIIYDLSSTGSIYLKTLYCLAVLSRKYYEAMGPSNGLVEIVIAEESQNYMRRRFDEPPSIGERIVNELRGFGVGIVLIAPDPLQIPWHIARDVGAVISLGSQALPDFLERMRHRYNRRGLVTIGRDNSTFVFHSGRLIAVRFRPRPPKPITLPYHRVAEAPIGTRQPLGRYSRMLGRLRPVPGRPPPPPPTPQEQPKQEVESEPLKLEEEPLEEVSEETERKPETAAEEKSGELRLEPEELGEPEEGEDQQPIQTKQEPKGRMSWMLSRSYPPPPPHARTRPGRPAIESAFPLGDHLVVETDGVLSCCKCGGTASLVEADRLAEKPCTPTRQQIQTTETVPCDVCKAGEGVEKTPILDPLTGCVAGKLLCRSCFKDYLRILRYAGPRVGRFKTRAPPGKVWFSYGQDVGFTLFEVLGGVWPCPTCEEFFDDLYGVVVHFADKHPELANKPLGKTVLKVEGGEIEVPRTFQGLACPYCGFFAENERHLTYHIQHDHR